MGELRWILLGLGVLLIAGLYFWDRRPAFLKRPQRPKLFVGRVKPVEVQAKPADDPAEKPAPQRRKPEKVVTLRVVRRHDDEIDAEEAVLALKRVGLEHGKYGIFHRMPDNGGDDPDFSVASLTEPGSFDLGNLEGTTIIGLSLFLTLPSRGDAVSQFDNMVAMARGLAEDLDGILLDERGSSWSIQRERYVREEIIQFCHQLDRA